LDETRRALEEIVHGDRLYVPAAVAYANVLRTQGERKEARRWLELLRDALPNHPVVLYNLAGLSAEEGNIEAARSYLDAIDTEDLPAELAEKVTAFVESLEPHLLPGYIMERIEEEYRRQADERPISPETLTLSRALNQIPAEWLNAACRLYRVPSPARLRRDRAQQLAHILVSEPATALRVLASLDHDGQTRGLLRLLLQRGGWARAGMVTRRFGPEEGDGYFWAEKLPTSPLGRLRVACLAFVGRATLEGRRSRVVAVPVDLRTALKGPLEGT
jgi:ATP/maltotriose-dependent transcriptional regulator MalT